MPKYRQLHIKILDSFDFAEMPDDFTRVVWLLLIPVVDSEGRGIDNPAWLRSKMFPLRQDVELSQISAAIEWLGSRGMIRRYQVSGKLYFCIPTWKEYQTGSDKEGKSVLPAPPAMQENNSEPAPNLLPTPSEPTSPQYNTIQYNADTSADTATVFTHYQNNIGIINKHMADVLNDAIKEYPVEWIIRAIDIAVENNARKWAYISAILERWKTNGYDAGKRNGKTDAVDLRNVPTEEY